MSIYTRIVPLGILAASLVGTAHAQSAATSVAHAVPTSVDAGPSVERLDLSPSGTTTALALDTIFSNDFSAGFEGWDVNAVTPMDTVLWNYSLADSINFGGARNYGPNFLTKENGYATINYSTYLAADSTVADSANQTLLSPYFSTIGQEGRIVTLSFRQFYAYNPINGATVSFTQDNDASFTTEVQVNAGLAVNTFAGSQISVIVPDEVLGVDSVRIRFDYKGARYAWAIDDVMVEAEDAPPASVFEEDFSDGFEGWTVTATTPDTALWRFTTDQTLTGRFTSGNVKPAGSTASTENGFALINYDFYNTGGIAIDSFASGAVAQYLISPSFSTDTVSGSLAVQMFSSYRYCCNAAGNLASVSYSIDGGATFSEPITADPSAEVNGASQGTLLVNMPAEMSGQTDVKLRFGYTGEFYYWAIDDIRLVARPNVDYRVNSNFYASAPNYSTPKSQVDTLYFLADIRNAGGQDQENAKLGISISNAAGMLIYTDTLDYGTVVSDSTYENKAFQTGFPMPTEIGVYTGTYEIFGDNLEQDANTEDNVASFEFEVTEDFYAKGESLDGGTRPGGDPQVFELGNLYLLPKFDSIASIDSIELGFFLRGLEDDDVATTVEVFTYGYKGDLNNDGLVDYGDFGDGEPELVQLAVNEIALDSSIAQNNSYSYVISPLLDGGSLELPRDEDYIGYGVSLLYSRSATSTPANNSFFMGESEVDYGAYNLAVDTLGFVNRNSTFVLNAAADEPAGQYGYNTFGNGWWINTFLTIDSVTVSVNELPETAFSVFPNPASTSISISYDFAEVGSVATFRVINAVGQQVRSFTEQSLNGGQIDMSTAGLNNGLYYIKVETGTGKQAVRKVFVQR